MPASDILWLIRLSVTPQYGTRHPPLSPLFRLLWSLAKRLKLGIRPAFQTIRPRAARRPNNPNIFDWFKTLICPWHLRECDDEPLGKHGNEWDGVSAAWAPNVNAQYAIAPNDQYVPGEPERRTMSCGLCGRLVREIGKAPFVVDPEPITSKDADLWHANWDFHPFGAWLANEGALQCPLSQHRPPLNLGGSILLTLAAQLFRSQCGSC